MVNGDESVSGLTCTTIGHEVFGEKIIIGGVLVLFGWAVALALVAVWLRWVSHVQLRRRRRIEATWRDEVDDLVLSGMQLAPVPQREQPVVLELLLRHRALLRGPEAARITAYLEEQGYVQRAVQELRARNRWRRARAAGLLGRMRSETAVSALVTMLHDESEDVRTVAARSLAAIGHPEAVEALAAALADPSRWTASAVAADLVEMGPAAVTTLIEIASAADSERAGARDAAVTAVRVLGEIRDPRAEPVLISLLRRAGDANMRARAAAALGRVSGPRASPALRAALRDREWPVRAQAAASLGALADRSGVRALSAAIADDSWWVRRNCAEALGKLGEPGRKALHRLAASSDPYVRDRCLAALEILALEDEPGAPGPRPAAPA
jgi:HEAT repeat protein